MALNHDMDPFELLVDGWPGVTNRPAQTTRRFWRRQYLTEQLSGTVAESTSVPELQHIPNAPVLGYEVLIHIMLLAALDEERPSVSALSRTCRALHHHGRKFLLLMSILLSDAFSLLSFTRFMLSPNNPSTFPHFRGRLHIRFNTVIPVHIVRPFADVLASCTSLTSLHIRHPKSFLDFHSDLCAAVSGLSALRDLLVEIGSTIKHHRYISRFFRALRCPLVIVRLEFFLSDHGKQVEYRREADPIWLFATVASSLECIALKGNYHIGMTHTYPQLRKCHIDARPNPSLRPLITSFPALRVLVSVPYPGPNVRLDQRGFIIHRDFNPAVWDAINENEAAWESFREANRNDLLANGCWESLDTLIANSLIAYTFALTCHIDRLHLLLQVDRSDRTVYMVAHVLRDARPRCLRLAFYMLDIEVVIYMLDAFIDIHNHLSELELRLNVSEDNCDVGTFLEQVATALEQSNLTSLRVEIVCFKGDFLDPHDIEKRDCLERKRQGILDYCVTKATIESTEVREIVGSFMALNESLRRMEIAWSSCYFDYGLERRIGIDLDVGPEVYDVPSCEDYPDDWDAAW